MLIYVYILMLDTVYTNAAKAFSTTNFVTLYLILFYITLQFTV